MLPITHPPFARDERALASRRAAGERVLPWTEVERARRRRWHRRPIWLVLLWLSLQMGVAPANAQGTNSLPALRTLVTTSEVRDLPLPEACREYPVEVRATVLVYDYREAPGTPFHVLFVTDGATAIFVSCEGPKLALKPGDDVTVTGHTGPGKYAPVIVEDGFEVHVRKDLPQAFSAGFEDVLSGRDDAQWVEVRGIVRSVSVQYDRINVELASGRYRLTAILAASGNTPDTAQIAVDSEATIRGAVFAIYNGNRQLLNCGLYCPAEGAVQMTMQPRTDPYTLPVRRFTELLRFPEGVVDGHRVRVQGVVAFHDAGALLFLSDGASGLMVKTTQPGQLNVGDEVDVSGFPATGAYQAYLEDAQFRKIRHASEPPPRVIDIATARSGGAEAALVRLRGRLVEQVRMEGERMLLLESEGHLLYARRLPDTADGASWADGSILEVTGICVAEGALRQIGAESWAPASIELLLRTPQDVKVIRAPSPWTRSRLALLLGSIAGALILALGWVKLLRRRVRAQTELIGQQLSRAAALEERNRISRELHDTLAQGFAGTAFALEGIAARLEMEAHPVGRDVDTALKMVRHSLAEARRSVMNLRPSALAEQDLGQALASAAREITLNAGVDLRTCIPSLRGSIPPDLEADLLRIGVEAVTNAVRHADPRRIDVVIAIEKGSIGLSVSDDGRGFSGDPEDSVPGRFGLRGMRERICQHGGKLVIRAQPEGGTTVTASAPIPDLETAPVFA